MNLNKGCIEIVDDNPFFEFYYKMNLNKGCIEIRLLVVYILTL